VPLAYASSGHTILASSRRWP